MTNIKVFAAAAFLGLATVPVLADTTVQDNAVTAWDANPAQFFDATDVNIDDFLWIARPVVVFAETAADPRFQQQIDLLSERVSALVERDVVVILDTAPEARSSARLKLRPRGFMLAILAKDGTVVVRKPLPWDVREISRSIDKLPLRQQEIRDRQAVGG